MDIASFLTEIANRYDRNAGLSTPTQALLKNAPTELAEHAPAGFVIQGSGEKGMATFTPWIGFFDPDETTSPQRGVYVVYIFAADLRSVVLTLNQGITDLTNEVGPGSARQKLAADAAAIRAQLPATSLDGLSETIDPADFADLDALADRLLRFEDRYNQTATPFDWRFKTGDLNAMLERVAGRQPYGSVVAA